MSDPSRPRAFRIGRSAWHYYWAGLVVLLGGPLAFFAARAAGGAAPNAFAWVVTLGAIVGVWTIVCAIIAATQRKTVLDPDAREISLRGEPWIPLHHITYGETRLANNTWAIGIGTHKGNVVWISDAFLFGDSRQIRRWAHWVVQCSSIPSADNWPEGTPGDPREDLLKITGGWAG